jgi:hypothetical protein
MASLCLNNLPCNISSIKDVREINGWDCGYAIQAKAETKKINNQIKIKDMKLKKYIFTIRYTENKEDKYGTLSLWANNLVHANDMFKRLYCKDRCGEYPEPELEVITVTESTSLI